jgi:transcription antitermination factor NusG
MPRTCNLTTYRPQAVDDGPSLLRDAGAPQWFALAVKPRHDKAVARTLETQGFQAFLPLYKKQHKYGSRLKESELPLFPGYVFCRFNALTKLPVLATPGVTHILGIGSKSIPLPQKEIVFLQAAVQAHIPLQPFPFLQVGQRVRIDKGALSGIEGIVISFKQCLRLVLSITLLQRSVLLEIDRDQISAEDVRRPMNLEVCGKVF